ncbi:unnamed protein product [Closterium sp. NIES-53]
MEGQGDNYATTSDIASLRTDMEQTQATLRRLEAFLTSQPGFATAATATTATAAPTTPAAVATPTFHGLMAPLSPNLEAARPRLPEAFDPSAKGSDVRRFVATLEIYFEAIGCSTPQHDAARIRLAATLSILDPHTASRPLSPVRIARRVPRLCPPSDPESDHARTASPTVSLVLAIAVTDPSFESTNASALVAELLDFAAACRLDYATALVAKSAEFESASPPSVGGECALGTDALEDRQEDFECLAAAVPRFASMLLAPAGVPDAPDIPTPRSYAEAITGTYVDEVPPPGANIVDGMWIFRRDYELHSLDFSTAFLQGSLHEEIWLRRPPGFSGSFPAGTQWSLRPPVYGLRQAPREWHDTLRTTLAALGFAPSTADLSLFLRTDTSLPPFYVIVYADDLVFATADTEALTLVKSELQKRHTCTDLSELRSYLGLQITRDRARRTITLTSGMGLVLGGRGPVVLTGHADASWVDDSATQRSSQGYTFSLDNKAMIALCQEHRLEHRTKHIALRYFLARELQQRGQLRLAYVATRANTADIFTKALPLGDHHRFSTVLGLLALRVQPN